MDASATNLRDQARGEAQALDTLQKELEKVQQFRTQYIQQQQENNMVLEELKLLDEESNVYKLIGPALVKQDPLEAKHNVEKRLEYIGHELGRLDGQAKGLDEKRVQKQQSIIRLQERMQRHSQSAKGVSASA